MFNNPFIPFFNFCDDFPRDTIKAEKAQEKDILKTQGWERFLAITVKEVRTTIICQSAAIRKGERFACLTRMSFSKSLPYEFCFGVPVKA